MCAQLAQGSAKLAHTIQQHSMCVVVRVTQNTASLRLGAQDPVLNQLMYMLF